MLHTNGEVRVSINGKPYLLKFGMLAAKLAERHPAASDSMFDQLAHILWIGLMSRVQENDLPTTFSQEDALRLLDDMSAEDVAKVVAAQKDAFERELPNVARRVAEIIANPTPPNEKPSEKTGKNSLKSPTK